MESSTPALSTPGTSTVSTSPKARSQLMACPCQRTSSTTSVSLRSSTTTSSSEVAVNQSVTVPSMARTAGSTVHSARMYFRS